MQDGFLYNGKWDLKWVFCCQDLVSWSAQPTPLLGPGSRSGFAPGPGIRTQSVVPSPPWTAQSTDNFSATSFQTSAPIPVFAMGCWWPGGKSPIPSSLQGINVSALQFPQFTAALDNFCHLQHQEFCHNNTGFQKVLTFLTDAASVVWRIAGIFCSSF